jgi:hypothetical protein
MMVALILEATVDTRLRCLLMMVVIMKMRQASVAYVRTTATAFQKGTGDLHPRSSLRTYLHGERGFLLLDMAGCLHSGVWAWELSRDERHILELEGRPKTIQGLVCVWNLQTKSALSKHIGRLHMTRNGITIFYER